MLPGRREFLAGVASAVVLGPLSAVAQQTQQPRRLGVLVGLAPSEDTPIAQAFIKPFRESMRSAGWIEGGNIQIDWRLIRKSPPLAGLLARIWGTISRCRTAWLATQC
jgi:hypothetical protein